MTIVERRPGSSPAWSRSSASSCAPRSSPTASGAPGAKAVRVSGRRPTAPVTADPRDGQSRHRRRVARRRRPAPQHRRPRPRDRRARTREAVTSTTTCAPTGVTDGWLYAVGDVNGRNLLTHMGKYQARIAADVILERADDRGLGRPPAPCPAWCSPIPRSRRRADRAEARRPASTPGRELPRRQRRRGDGARRGRHRHRQLVVDEHAPGGRRRHVHRTATSAR